MEKIVLRESHAPYTLTIDAETIGHEALIVRQDGQPIAMLAPLANYKAFRTWQLQHEQTEPREEQRADFERERAAFNEMLPTLLQTHPGKVVAVYQGEIVEVGDEVGATLGKVYEHFGYVACYVQRVEVTPRVYKILHQKVINSSITLGPRQKWW